MINIPENNAACDFLFQLLMIPDSEDIILEMADVAKKLTMKGKEKEYLKKYNVLKQFHITKDGTMRSITPINKNGMTYYFTRFQNGQSITAKSLEALIDKLLLHYNVTILEENFSVETTWNLFFEEYRLMNPSKVKTLRNLEADYHRYFDSEFVQLDVREITAKDIEKYAQKLILNLHMKKKAFLSFKSLLNRIFETAIYNGWINGNPAKGVHN